ncbi:gp16 family protein [Vibrio nomapromontoriensis]|uniref:gp16 family protein n=1 Tax=Vibrio nomapromontoriensis TaxID=2910246 RepID=UPI003D0EB9ED
MKSRQSLIQLIHIAKNQLAMDEDIYRLLLQTTTGKTSCKAMNLTELDTTLKAMEAKGFKRQFKAKQSGVKRRLSPKSGKSKNRMIDKCRAIWITMYQQGIVRDGSEAALDKYTQRVLSKREDKVDCIAWCDVGQAYVVLESLKCWYKRVMNREVNLS